MTSVCNPLFDSIKQLALRSVLGKKRKFEEFQKGYNNEDAAILQIPALLRGYTITCKDDVERIEAGKCPEYAKTWSEDLNKKHWTENHKYISPPDTPNSYLENTEERGSDFGCEEDAAKYAADTETVAATDADEEDDFGLEYDDGPIGCYDGGADESPNRDDYDDILSDAGDYNTPVDYDDDDDAQNDMFVRYYNYSDTNYNPNSDSDANYNDDDELERKVSKIEI
jgi:hypothetical protein